ncbi:MAG: recombinase family protein [Spirochaetota bacterium]|nr:recombinase family protein [Spirochaetota bacterium]
MVYAYIRVSTDKQSVENQEYEILRFADTKEMRVNEWIKETVSGTKNHRDRKLGEVIERLKKGDIMIVSEISRLGRSLMEVMGILNVLMEKGVQVYSVKEKYEPGKKEQIKKLLKISLF